MMKNSSIKKRVTLYYAFVMISITLIISLLLSFSIERQISVITKDTLMKAVQNSFEDIEYENQIIEIDNDFDAYVKGVTLLVYSESGNLVKGSVPTDFPSYTPLSTGDYQELETDEHIWLIYDQFHTYENGQGLWVRGIYAMDDATDTLAALRRILNFTLPVILIVAILAGHRITKRAFDPVIEITEAANSINYGQDLSKRLPQSQTKDEIYDLTETLNNMIGRLDEAFKAEKHFSSDVSHELKTPLAVILAECEYILQQDREANEYKESLETIQAQTQRTMSMVQQLLQISRSINKENAIEKEVFPLSMLAESLVEELSIVAEEQGVQIIGEIEPDIEISADETLIMRVMMNLMTNGIKYRKQDIDNAYVKISIKQTNNQIFISVSDNGIGIAEEDQANVFRRFYKVDKSRNRQGESFGLGLAMVKWIVEAHDGSISVESRVGEGSTFTVTLPKE